MASMNKKEAFLLVVDIIEKHLSHVTEEEAQLLAEEIVDRMENVEIYDTGEMEPLFTPVDEDEEE